MCAQLFPVVCTVFTAWFVVDIGDVAAATRLIYRIPAFVLVFE